MESEHAVTTCYRHAEVESYVRCTRCERVTCPDSMREAAVGFHCGMGTPLYLLAGLGSSVLELFLADPALPSPGRAWQGRLGGLLTGGAVAPAFAYAPRRPRRGLIQAAACVAVLALLVPATVARVGELTSGGVQ
ncbi:hypothetical protein AB0I00_01360 [Streptomyces sp. NPDC050803]|uniref:hypothetical protein n=1 Tax=unclassified Streptomyces TaxID=2593676 RepID=UPI00343D4E86